MLNPSQKSRIFIIFLLSNSIIISFYFTFYNEFKYSSDISVYAQINNANGSLTTMIGNVTIPSQSNDTKTTAIDHNISNTVITGINKTSTAQNVTTASNILKENTTYPISPTGISTQSLHQPPEHRLVDNGVNTTIK